MIVVVLSKRVSLMLVGGTEALAMLLETTMTMTKTAMVATMMIASTLVLSLSLFVMEEVCCS